MPTQSAGEQAEAGPLDETLPAGPPPSPSPSPGDRPGGRFDPRGPEEAAAMDAEDLYQAPTQYGQPARQPYVAASPLAASRVSGPAVGLIVTGAIGLPLSIGAVLLNMMGVGFGAFHGELDVVPKVFSGGVNVALNLIEIIFSILVIVGALKMKNLENYGFAMAASIMAIVPCISPCCVLGLPFGIWALVVLSDAQVKAAFRS